MRTCIAIAASLLIPFNTFAGDLHCPTGFEFWNGGVLVAQQPDLVFLKDTDGDGKADVRKAVFTGFGRDHAGEAMLNSFRWGLDNRFHVSTSLSGGDVRRADRKDATARDPEDRNGARQTASCPQETHHDRSLLFC